MNKDKKDKDFKISDIPDKDFKKILEQAADKANKEQRRLMKEYDRKLNTKHN